MVVTGCGNIEERIIEKQPEVKADPAGEKRLQATTRNRIIDELQKKFRENVTTNLKFARSLMHFSSAAIFDPDLTTWTFELLGGAPNAKQGNLTPFLARAAEKGTPEKLASDLHEATTRT